MKVNKWMLGAGGAVALSLLGLTMVDVKSYFELPRRNVASIAPLECVKSGDQIIGFRAGATEQMVRRYPSLDNVRSLVFMSVRVTDGDIRFVSGGYRENVKGDGNEAFGYGYDQYYGFGSYGSYASNGVPDPNDMGSGLARLVGGAHIEIKAERGQLLKFRGAPLASTQLFFQGRWERPGDDPAFTERMLAVMQIARAFLGQCK